MKSLFTIFALTLLTSTFAHAALPVNESLLESVTEQFYIDGTNPKAGLGQVMAQVLGRKLTRADFQVITLSSTAMRTPWAFSYATEDKKACVAGDNSSEFLILLRAKVKNTQASTYVSYAFKVTAEQTLVAAHRDGIEIGNCSDVSEDNGLYVIAPAQNLVGDFSYVEIAEPKQADGKN